MRRLDAPPGRIAPVACRPRGVLVALAAWLLACALAAPALASASNVVLLRLRASDPLTRQAETRLGAELRAAGFSVTEVDHNPAVDLRAEIEATSARLRPIATIALYPVEEARAAEVWLLDRVTGKLVIRRVDTVGSRPGEGSADMALRAVELLRGSLLEIKIESAGPPASADPPPDVTRFVDEAVEPVRSPYALTGFGFGLSGVFFWSAGGLTNGAPRLQLTYGTAGGFLFRAGVSALSSTATVDRPEGTAHIQQTGVSADVLRLFRARAPLQPYAGLGVGLRRFRVEGFGRSALFPGHNRTRPSLYGALGGGLLWRLGAHAALFSELTAAVEPRPLTVVIAGQHALSLVGVSAVLTVGVATTF